jgi:flagellar hook-associated protein 3 FlgL
MSSFPTAFGRAPTMMMSQLAISRINSTNFALGRLNEQLASGLDLLRPSDDPVRSATVSMLDSRISLSDQLVRNLGFAQNSLDTLDLALGEAKGLIDEALSIASDQISSPNDAESRNSQAVIIDSLIDSLFGISNRESMVGHIFGGTAPGHRPVSFVNGGYQFTGTRGGLYADLGDASDIPITIGADNAIGALSSRIQGSVDLDPSLTSDTLISDLNGAQNAGVSTGVVEFSFNGGPTARIDLTGADTIGDVTDRIEAAIIQYESDNAVSILGPGGVSISGEGISIDVPSNDLTFTDIPGSSIATDFGLATNPASPFNAGNAIGIGLDPKLTWTTPISALTGLGGASLDQISLNSNGSTYNIDLSGATTIADIRSAIEAGNTGVRVELDENGQAFNIVTETAGVSAQAMSISEVSGGNDTATLLGIRSLSADTLINDFNDGRGVDFVSGRTDPLTGVVDPALNVDFIITLGDGFEIPIDLNSGAMTDVGTLLSAINTQADAALTAASRPTSDFTASLSNPENGLDFTQAGTVGGSIGIKSDNGSQAAQQLGLLAGKSSNGGDTIRSEDRAKVRVDNLFTHLLDLAEALRNNDTFGIQLASDKLEGSLDGLIQSRSRVGGHARRISQEVVHQEDRQVFDISMRSSLRDLDFASASATFAQLQMQLQAGLSVAAQSQQLTLLDFLG